jgi:hypothetical protein
MDELDAGQRDVTHLLGLIIGVAKTNLPIFDGFQAAVGDMTFLWKSAKSPKPLR